MRAPLDAVATSRRYTTCRVGMCLYYVQTWFDAGWSGPYALWAWRNAKYKRTSWPPPAGVPVFWDQDANTSYYGHIAISTGNGRCRSTDYPYTGRVGEASIAEISRHFSRPYLGWTEDLGGQRIALPKESPWASGPVYLSKLHYGQKDSDSVRRLKHVLRTKYPVRYRLFGLRMSGYYGKGVDRMVRWHQKTFGHKWGQTTVDPKLKSYVGPKQANFLFSDRYSIRR